MDYLLSSDQSFLFVMKCAFFSTRRYGISVDNRSTLDFVGSTLRDIDLSGIVVTGGSQLTSVRSTFRAVSCDCLCLLQQCHAQIIRCEFSGLQRRAVTVRSAGFVNIEYCSFTGCMLTCLYILLCEQLIVQNCRFSDASHTMIYVEKTKAIVKRTTIVDAKGNGLNISHESECLVEKSRIERTQFPPIAVCEGSSACVKKCEVSDSGMCGVIVRGGSRAVVKKSIIRDVKVFGVAVSDSENVFIRRCIIQNSEHSAIACYNHSVLGLDGVTLLGSRYGVNVFTGGHVTVADSSIHGMAEAAVWLHHAGGGSFRQLVMSAGAIPAGRDVPEFVATLDFDRGECADATKFFRIETARAVQCTDSIAAGIGPFAEAANPDAEAPPVGELATPGTCKLCGGDASNAMFRRCGHTVYCRNCWERMDPKVDVCELCLMPTDGIVAPINCSHEGEEGTCSICFAQPSNTFVLPCGHMTCWDCASRWFAASTECPFCREKNARPQRGVSYI
jgi:hypothetical protein